MNFLFMRYFFAMWYSQMHIYIRHDIWYGIATCIVLHCQCSGRAYQAFQHPVGKHRDLEQSSIFDSRLLVFSSCGDGIRLDVLPLIIWITYTPTKTMRIWSCATSSRAVNTLKRRRSVHMRAESRGSIGATSRRCDVGQTNTAVAADDIVARSVCISTSGGKQTIT